MNYMRGLKSRSLRSKNITSSIFYTAVRVLIVLSLIYAIWAQNNLVIVKDYTYKLRDIPDGFVGYKVVAISDIVNTNNSFVNKVLLEKPNVILLSGGYSDKNGRYNRTVEAVNKLTKIAKVYYVYNKRDHGDELKDTDAINITDNSVEVKAVNNKKAAGKSNDKDLSDLDKSNHSNKLYICGMGYQNKLSDKDIEDKAKKITKYNTNDTVIMISGDIQHINSIGKGYADIIFAGGTFGKKDKTTGLSRGYYKYNGIALFLSGGVGNNQIRVFNLPQIYSIKLSDRSANSKNALEELLDAVMPNIKSKFEDDEGLSNHRYSY